MKADLLEEFERNKLESEVSNYIVNFLLDASCTAEKRGEAPQHLITSSGCIVEAHPT